MTLPQACPLCVASSPLAGGRTGGPAKPVPRCAPNQAFTPEATL